MALEIGRGGHRLHTFACARDAEEGARIIAQLSPGVVAFQQWGDAEAGLWEPPCPLVSYGAVPADALGDPAEIAA